MESDQFNRFFKQDNKQNDELIVQAEKGLEKISLSDVYYIEQDGSNSVVHLAEEEIKIQKSMDECEELFTTVKFMRTCESYIVNVDKIFIVKFPEIIIVDKMTVIPVDENKRSLLEIMMKK
jgi:DNA-binding LytR/AlgR family response regulator